MSETVIQVGQSCANCLHWHKIRKMPHGSCELYKAKGIENETPHFDDGERIINSAGRETQTDCAGLRLDFSTAM